jgi:murein DD-endopeptidase MepM/ murein hydrolase activator NlpD
VGQKLKVHAEQPVTEKKKKTPPVQGEIAEPQPAPKEYKTASDTYVVKKGDILGEIAKQNGMTVTELKKLNNLKNNRLDVGQKLKVKAVIAETPIKKKTEPEPQTVKKQETPPVPSGEPITYKVKRRDNLGKIAKQYGLTVDELKAMNNLTSTRLDVGQELIVGTQKEAPPKKKKPETPVVKTSLADTTITSITTEKKKSGKKTYEEVTVNITYKVKPNDSLSKIAKKYGLTAQEIKKYNKLKSNALKVGQKLKIRTVERRPVKKEEVVILPPVATAVMDTSSTGKVTRPLTAEELPDEYIYVVKPKDNLYRIALNNGLKTEELLKFNGFASDNEVISAGQKIIIKDPAPYLSTLSGTNPNQTGTSYTASDSTLIEKVYIVQRKDTLFKIARENGITVEELKRINNLTSNSISKGQKLYIVAPANGITKPEKMEPIVSEEDLKTKSVLRTDLIMPVDGKVLSQYGIRNGRPHKGIDLGAPNGTPVFAVLDGTVVYSGLQGNYGNVVVVEHPDYVMTVYAHNEKNLVSVGDIVKQGQILATVGSTGNATAPHVHFEYRIKGKAINPRKVLPMIK